MKNACRLAIGLFTLGLSIGLLARPPAASASRKSRAIRAFPGDERFGSTTPGGRGGRVIFVTNLDDAGPGSFRAACEAEGPRIVIFRVSGLITLAKPIVIKNPYVTIAGQTAPGDGIHIGEPSDLSFYIRENVFEGNCALTADNSQFFDPVTIAGRKQVQTVAEPFNVQPVRTVSAQSAYEAVLGTVGASLPRRDSVDARIVDEVRQRKGSIIDSQEQVGGWPVL